MSRLQAGLLLLAVVPLLWGLMWLGWRRRSRRHDLPPLVPVPLGGLPAPLLEADGTYYGTTVSGDWLDRVVARRLGARSSCRLHLSDEGLDLVRFLGPFRIPAGALRGARHDQGIAGKVVPPHGVLVVTWQHGDLLLDTGFRLVDGGTTAHNQWVGTISSLISKQEDAA